MAWTLSSPCIFLKSIISWLTHCDFAELIEQIIIRYSEFLRAFNISPPKSELVANSYLSLKIGKRDFGKSG